MHRTLAAVLALSLSACAAHQPPEIPRVSLKDVSAPVGREAASRFLGLGPVTVSGADPATNSAVALAMFHAINLDRIPINTPDANWTLTGDFAFGAIVWTLKDEAGNVRGTVRLETPQSIDPAGLASASLTGLKPLLPRSAFPSTAQGIRL